MGWLNASQPLLGVIAGGLITWLVSRHYYKRAGDELREEAKALRNQTRIILLALEDMGYVTLNKDEHGNIEGRLADVRVNISPSLNAGGNLKLRESPSSQEGHNS